MENADYRDVIKDPNFRRLSQKGVNFTQFFGENHPSQPNYIAMIGGDTLGVDSNSNVNLKHQHLGDLLEEKGLDWKVYAEDFPGKCFLGTAKGAYARRHVPFLSFTNVQKNSSRCAKIMGTTTLLSDWKNNKLANFNLIIPNNKSNGHDTSISHAGKWLAETFESQLQVPNLMKDTLLIITFDEGSYKLKNQIYTILIGPSVIEGTTNNDKHNHYSLLRMLEEEWALNSLNRNDLTASSILQIWR
jgi:hypothetical protein